MKKDFLAKAGFFLILGSVLLIILFVAEKQRLQDFVFEPQLTPSPSLLISPSPLAPSPSTPLGINSVEESPAISPKVETRKPSSSKPVSIPTQTSPLPTPSETILVNWQNLAQRTVVALLCGNHATNRLENAIFGSGVIINSSGQILTNNHVVYDDTKNALRTDCFVLKQTAFGDVSRPKIYYWAKTTYYNLNLKGYEGPGFSYGNDFALLQIQEKISFQNVPPYFQSYVPASESDFSQIETSPGVYRWFPFDWSYMPQEGDFLTLVGYAAKDREFPSLSSLGGNISGMFYILNPGVVESIRVSVQLTKGMSGGITINPKTGKAIGLNYATAEGVGDFLFRDFINSQMLEDFGFSLRSIAGK